MQNPHKMKTKNSAAHRHATNTPAPPHTASCRQCWTDQLAERTFCYRCGKPLASAGQAILPKAI